MDFVYGSEQYRSPPPPTAKPHNEQPHRKRCLRVKAPFAGTAQSTANTAFAARAAIAVAAVRWRRRCGRGAYVVHEARTPPLGCLPHPPRARLLTIRIVSLLRRQCPPTGSSVTLDVSPGTYPSCFFDFTLGFGVLEVGGGCQSRECADFRGSWYGKGGMERTAST